MLLFYRMYIVIRIFNFSDCFHLEENVYTNKKKHLLKEKPNGQKNYNTKKGERLVKTIWLI